jgi:hypothetical protein
LSAPRPSTDPPRSAPSLVQTLRSDVVATIGAAHPSSRPAPSPTIPYRVKGNIYLGTQAFFEHKVPGGLELLYSAIRDPELLAFIQQRFLAVAWYDVLPAVPLIRAEARALGLTVRRYLTLRSAYQAERDLTGIYRFLLKVAGTEMVALKLPQLFVQIFDFGASDARVIEAGHVRGYVRDFPSSLSEWFSISIETYAMTALRLTGANEGSVASRRVDSAATGSVPLSSLQLDLRWKV